MSTPSEHPFRVWSAVAAVSLLVASSARALDGQSAVGGPLKPVSLRPIATTTELLGFEDTPSVVRLSARMAVQIDHAAERESAGFVFDITALPADGQLLQADGTPISSVPTRVTHPNGDVLYLGPPNACTFEDDPPHGSFSYAATSVSSGRASLPQSVAIHLDPVYDPVAWWPGQGDLEAVEDEPLLFRLPPSPEGAYYITETFDDLGLFFQVLDDDATLGPMIDADDAPVRVANERNWLCFVPNPNHHGNTLAFFSFTHSPDHWPELPIYANDLRVDVNVASVNDPPNAQSSTFTGPNYALALPGTMNFNDLADGFAADHLTVTITRLPQWGRLYVDVDSNWQDLPQRPDLEVTGVGQTFTAFERHFMYVRDAADLGYLYESGCPFDDFAFVVHDGGFTTDEAVVTLCIDMVNLPPEMDPDWEPVVMLEEDGVGMTRFTPTDWPGGSGQIFVVPVSLPEHGTLWYVTPVFGGGSMSIPVYLNEPLPVPLGLEFEWWELQYVPDPGFNTQGAGPDTWSFRIHDGFNAFVPDLEAPIDFWGDYVPRTFTGEFHVSAVNDAPSIDGPAPFLAPWGAPAAVTGIVVEDDAASDAVLRVTITSTDTTFSFADLGGVEVISQSPTFVVFMGTLSQINGAFAASISVPSPPVSHSARHLLVIANDQGNTGDGGALASSLVVAVQFD